jgi:hypothetical protein
MHRFMSTLKDKSAAAGELFFYCRPLSGNEKEQSFSP